MKKVTPAKVGIYTVLTFWAVTTLYPFVWVILNSFRERGLIRKESFSIPLPGSGFTMDNYAKAMERFDFGNAYLNSLLVSVAVTIMVVLIDDEAIITQGLQKVVDWAAYRCRVAAVAQDAVTGAEVIRQHRPDILFTDIKMPGEDGLTMLAGLKGEFPRMQIAVLTGYRDFEYAQRAIRLGVARFLLKPSRMDELNEALAHMTGVLDRPPGGGPAPAPRGGGPQQLPGAPGPGLHRGALRPAPFPPGCGRPLLRQPVAPVQAAEPPPGPLLLRPAQRRPCPPGQAADGRPGAAHQRGGGAGGLHRHRPLLPGVQKAGGGLRRGMAEPPLWQGLVSERPPLRRGLSAPFGRSTRKEGLSPPFSHFLSLLTGRPCFWGEFFRRPKSPAKADTP